MELSFKNKQHFRECNTMLRPSVKSGLPGRWMAAAGSLYGRRRDGAAVHTVTCLHSVVDIGTGVFYRIRGQLSDKEPICI